MPSNAVRPFATTRTGRRKSKSDGDNSSVNARTPSVDASTTFPSRTRSTRPDGLRRGKIARRRHVDFGGLEDPFERRRACRRAPRRTSRVFPRSHVCMPSADVAPGLDGRAVHLDEPIAGAQPDANAFEPGTTSNTRRPRSTPELIRRPKSSSRPRRRTFESGRSTLSGHAAEAIDDEPVRPVVPIGALGLPRDPIGQRLARMIVDEFLERRTLFGPPGGRVIGLRVHAKHDGAAQRLQVIRVDLSDVCRVQPIATAIDDEERLVDGVARKHLAVGADRGRRQHHHVANQREKTGPRRRIS